MSTTITANANTFQTPTSATTQTSTDTSAAAKDAKSLNQNFDQFLTLLTTQLKNQDPLSPMDSTQFTNQLVSFSQVEQQIKTNDNLTKLVNLTNTSQTTLGLSYIGLNVDMQGSQFEYPGSGTTSMNYKLPSDASIVTINVLDKDGNTVYTKSGDGKAGTHNFVWDGKDKDGQQLAAGVYKLQVSALDSAQKTLSTTTVVPGYVSGIATANDGTINLIIGRLSTQIIPLSSVTQASL